MKWKRIKEEKKGIGRKKEEEGKNMEEKRKEI
jgi:hypothetical protein